MKFMSFKGAVLDDTGSHKRPVKISGAAAEPLGRPDCMKYGRGVNSSTACH